MNTLSYLLNWKTREKIKGLKQKLPGFLDQGVILLHYKGYAFLP